MSAKRAYHVAQFNWGVLIDDWDTPTVAEFQDNLDRVNALAMRSPGYVWHMPSDEMEASQMDPDGSLGPIRAWRRPCRSGKTAPRWIILFTRPCTMRS